MNPSGGFRVQGLGFRGLGFRVQDLVFRVQVLGFRGLDFWDLGKNRIGLYRDNGKEHGSYFLDFGSLRT